MEPNKQSSTRSIPQLLVLAAALLLVGRLIDMGVRNCQPALARSGVSAIHWKEFPELSMVDEIKRPMEVKKPDTLSPESTEAFNKLMRESHARKKYVLYEFYARWSDACKRMESTSMSNSQVDELVNKHFLPVRITDRVKESGRNPRLVKELQKEFHVFAFPTLIVLDADGEQIASLIGNCSSLTTYRFLTRALYSIENGGKKFD